MAAAQPIAAPPAAGYIRDDFWELKGRIQPIPA
jgi:hypothetical protein